jgi:hypothetical protein
MSTITDLVYRGTEPERLRAKNAIRVGLEQ